MKILVAIAVVFLLELVQAPTTSPSADQTVRTFRQYAPLLRLFLAKTRQHAAFADLARQCHDATLFVRQLESLNLILLALAYDERVDVAHVIRASSAAVPLDSIPWYTVQGMRQFLRRVAAVPLSALSASPTIRAFTSYLRHHTPPPTDGLMRSFFGPDRGVQLSASCLRLLVRVALNEPFFDSYLRGIAAVVARPPKFTDDRETPLAAILAEMAAHEIQIPQAAIETEILRKYESQLAERVRDVIPIATTIEPTRQCRLFAGAFAASTVIIMMAFFLA